MSGENKLSVWEEKLHVKLTTSCNELLGYYYVDGGSRTPMAQNSLRASHARQT